MGQFPAFDNANIESAILALGDYPTFRSSDFNADGTPKGLEGLHDQAHVYFGNVSPHLAFRDPFVYLLHSYVDLIFAKWQSDPSHPERLNPDTVYGAESNLDVPVTDCWETFRFKT